MELIVAKSYVVVIYGLGRVIDSLDNVYKGIITLISDDVNTAIYLRFHCENHKTIPMELQ